MIGALRVKIRETTTRKCLRISKQALILSRTCPIWLVSSAVTVENGGRWYYGWERVVALGENLHGTDKQSTLHLGCKGKKKRESQSEKTGLVSGRVRKHM